MDWFSKQPESVLEQEALVLILKNAGYSVDKLQSEVNTVDKLFSTVWNSALKAHKDGLTITKHSSFGDAKRNTAKNFARKMVGNAGEYLLDGVVNSKQHGKLVPSNWSRSVHRAEYGVPDLEQGSPDRVILDIHGNPFVLASVKFYAPYSTGWEQDAKLPNAFYWAMAEKPNYPALSSANTIGLFTNQSEPRNTKFPGGSITSDSLRIHLDVTNEGQTSNQTFWNDFWTELFNNVAAEKTIVANKQRIEKYGPARTPDNFQQSLIDSLNPTGPQTAVESCGVGKMVQQTAIIPRGRSINLIVSGVRLVLASQMYNSMKRDIGSPFHCVHVMTGQDYHKEYDEFADVAEQQHTTKAEEIARIMVEYTLRKDDSLPLHILTIEQSLPKVVKALQLIESGDVRDEDGNLFWEPGSDKHVYWKNKVIELCTEAIYDEAHNLVSGDPVKGQGASTVDKEDKRKTAYLTSLPYMNSVFTRSTYWTATRRLNGSKRDMANMAMFGQVVVCVRPSTAIKLGYVVRPKIIAYEIYDEDIEAVAKVTDFGDLREDSLEITYYIKCLENALKDCTERGLPCQIMVFVDDASKQEKFAEIATKYFESDGLVADVVRADTKQKDRKAIFERFSSSKFSVLFNYAIVHEGVDIDSCTGVILGRVLNEIWLVQAIGRAQRLLKEDRNERFGDIENYRKQYGLVYTLVDKTSAASGTFWDTLKDIYWKIALASGDADWLDFDVGGGSVYTNGRPEPKVPTGQPETKEDHTENSDDLKDKLRKVHDEMVERLNADIMAHAEHKQAVAAEHDDTMNMLKEWGIEL
jgi:hypothetical protein